MNTTDVIKSIIKANPQIDYLYIVEYGNQKDVKKDSTMWSISDDSVFKCALNLRNAIGLPFWQSLMLSNINASAWSKECLDACIRHNTLRYKKISSFDFICSDFIAERIGISSKVILQNKDILHIPFIDFHVPVSAKNTEMVEYICSLMDNPQEGYLLNSGNSYHYIGTALMSENQMIKFLAKANLFSPITDSAWISHQLFERSCTLRIGKKNGILPVVLKKIYVNAPTDTSL